MLQINETGNIEERENLTFIRLFCKRLLFEIFVILFEIFDIVRRILFVPSRRTSLGTSNE